MDLDRVADELYALAPGPFVAARDERAAAAKAAGDPALSASIKKLRKPTFSAWLANQLVRDRPDDIAALIELGSRLRLAQDELAGDQLRELSRQRQDAVTTLTGAARRLGQGAGVAVNEAATDELAGTLQAAVADVDAGNALRSGRLTSALRYAGTGLDAFTSFAPNAGRRLERADAPLNAPPRTLPKARHETEDATTRRQRADAVRAAVSAAKAAERRASAARKQAAAVANELSGARSSFERARSEAEQLERKVEELERRAAELDQQLRLAEADERAAQRRLDEHRAGQR